MKARLVIALNIQIVASLFSLIGWIDALEGGVAVAMVGLLTVGAWMVGRVRIPHLTWISLAVAFALSATTITLLLVAYDPMQSDAQFANNPLTPTIRLLDNVFRAAAVAVIAGSVFYAMKIADAIRRAKATGVGA